MSAGVWHIDSKDTRTNNVKMTLFIALAFLVGLGFMNVFIIRLFNPRRNWKWPYLKNP
ncbi:hypothetical protein MARINOS108_20049 [Marinoscillum sp. 108]|nr:hypothetical protein MARINOS108_20049 [Marinoscillum sp. 108]